MNRPHTPLRRLRRSSMLAATILAMTATASHAQSRPLVVTGATVHTMQSGTKPLLNAKPLLNCTIVAHHGKILCMGTDCAVPAGAQVVKAPNAIVLPGLVESVTHAGLEEVSLEPASGDGTIAHVRNVAHVRAIDGITLNSRVVTACRNGAVTTLVARPLGRALISGQSVAFTAHGTTIDDALVKSPVAAHAHVGAHAAVPKGGIVLSRSGQIAGLRQALRDAQAVATASRPDPQLAKLARDGATKALVAVVTGKIPLAVHVNKADSIAAVLRLAAELKIRVVIVGGAEAHLVAHRLAASKTPVILSPAIARPYSFDTLRAVDDNAARLFRAGVQLALSTGSSHNARHLRWAAGWAVASGLPHAEALRAITTTPAQILGLGANVGTLKVGGDATFAVFTGDPLSVRSRIKAVIVRGALVLNPTQR
jgi:imidazolonepropionase-like amidohydrolase